MGPWRRLQQLGTRPSITFTAATSTHWQYEIFITNFIVHMTKNIFLQNRMRYHIGRLYSFCWLEFDKVIRILYFACNNAVCRQHLDVSTEGVRPSDHFSNYQPADSWSDVITLFLRLSKQYIRQARYVIALDFASVICLKILAVRLAEMMPGRVGSCDGISITRDEL